MPTTVTGMHCLECRGIITLSRRVKKEPESNPNSPQRWVKEEEREAEKYIGLIKKKITKTDTVSRGPTNRYRRRRFKFQIVVSLDIH